MALILVKNLEEQNLYHTTILTYKIELSHDNRKGYKFIKYMRGTSLALCDSRCLVGYVLLALSIAGAETSYLEDYAQL